MQTFIYSTKQGQAGDNMGCLLRGIKREQIRRGQVIIAPGSMKSVKKFQAQVYVSYFCRRMLLRANGRHDRF